MKKLLAGTLCVGLWYGPVLLAQSKEDRKERTSKDMQEAIAFERAKDAADARQARMEARHPSVPTPDAASNADRMQKEDDGRKVQDPAAKKDK
jgi:hypothetical protein